MSEYHFAFVILHYLVYDETVQCVEHIQKNVINIDYDVIVVDNASPNNSGNQLKNKYKNKENIYIIKNEMNLGFSKGNNIGYRFAKEELKSDFIVVMNNDLFINDSMFADKIIHDYRKYEFAVLGPRIYTFEDKIGIQNPMSINVDSDDLRMKFLLRRIRDLKIAKFCSYVNLDLMFYGVKDKLANLLKNKKGSDVDHDHIQVGGVTLHGSIWIFSKNYIEKFDGLEEITFMYNEEMILYRQIQEYDLLSMYDPEIHVLHAEKAATLKVKRNKSASRRVRYEREYDSAICLYNYLNEQSKTRS